MYSKNIIVRRNVKYRTVRIMEQVGRFIDLLAEKRIGIIRKGAFTRKRKLSYQSVFLTILDVGRETLQMKLARVLPKTGCEEECSQQAFSKARSNMDHTAFRGLYPMNTAIRNVYCWVRTRETSGEVGALCCCAGNGD